MLRLFFSRLGSFLTIVFVGGAVLPVAILSFAGIGIELLSVFHVISHADADGLIFALGPVLAVAALGYWLQVFRWRHNVLARQRLNQWIIIFSILGLCANTGASLVFDEQSSNLLLAPPPQTKSSGLFTSPY